jgi:hypothetical protein
LLNLDRRSLIIGAGSLAAASWLPKARAGVSPLEIPIELQSLIARQRGSIIAAMASDDVPGAAVCLLYQGRPVWSKADSKRCRKGK